MRSTLQSLAALALATFTMTSCSPDDFNSGWDEQIVAQTVTLNQANGNDISLGTLNIENEVIDYINENQSDAESFTILSALPTSGSVASVDLFGLSFVEDLEVYAVQNGSEILIGRLTGDITNTTTSGFEGVDNDLYAFGSTDDIELLLRPTYNEIGSELTLIDVEIRFAASFTISGTK